MQLAQQRKRTARNGRKQLLQRQRAAMQAAWADIEKCNAKSRPVKQVGIRATFNYLGEVMTVEEAEQEAKLASQPRRCDLRTLDSRARARSGAASARAAGHLKMQMLRMMRHASQRPKSAHDGMLHSTAPPKDHVHVVKEPSAVRAAADNASKLDQKELSKPVRDISDEELKSLPSLHSLVRRRQRFLQRRHIFTQPRRITSKANRWADMLSRGDIEAVLQEVRALGLTPQYLAPYPDARDLTILREPLAQQRDEQDGGTHGAAAVTVLLLRAVGLLGDRLRAKQAYGDFCRALGRPARGPTHLVYILIRPLAIGGSPRPHL